MNENKDHSVKNALEAVAKQEGISVETMRREIDIVIAAARQSDDPVVQNLWKLVSEKGGASLTPEDVIAYFAEISLAGMDENP